MNCLRERQTSSTVVMQCDYCSPYLDLIIDRSAICIMEDPVRVLKTDCPADFVHDHDMITSWSIGKSPLSST